MLLTVRPLTMAGSMLLRIFMFWIVQCRIVLLNIVLRQGVKTRFVFILPIWGILSAGMSSMVMVTTHCIDSAFMLMFFVSIIL